MNQAWHQLCTRIRNCQRHQRLRVIALLDDAVEDEFINQRTADDLLTEWDVRRFPEQMPLPLRAHIEKLQREGRSLLSHNKTPTEVEDEEEEEEEPCDNVVH